MEFVHINIAPDDFRKSTVSCFKELLGAETLADVTLVCGDGQQIKAHKCILSFGSSLFKNIFETNKVTHPVIFMRGTKLVELKYILNFIYLGEVQIDQNSLAEFTAIAKDLGVKGFSKSSNMDRQNLRFQYTNIENTDEHEHIINEKVITNYGRFPVTNRCEENRMQQHEQKIEIAEVPMNNVNLESDNIEKAVQRPSLNLTITDCYVMSGRNVRDLKQDKNGKFTCTDCDFVNKCRITVVKHCLNKHVDLKLQCDGCKLQFRGLLPLRYHKRSVHEGVYFCCDICPYRASTNNNLRKHMEKYH